jgi:hypothetical protein
MLDGIPMRDAVARALRRQEDIADDRQLREGRLGDEELTALLLPAYPTITGQLN